VIFPLGMDDNTGNIAQVTPAAAKKIETPAVWDISGPLGVRAESVPSTVPSLR
jgi:hypothetical protein